MHSCQLVLLSQQFEHDSCTVYFQKIILIIVKACVVLTWSSGTAPADTWEAKHGLHQPPIALQPCCIG